jgi:hypothetical protein
MGNPDLVFIFNDVKVLILKGHDWQNMSRNEAFQMAITRYLDEARQNIEHWQQVAKENPDAVDPNWNVEAEWSIDSIKVYDSF